MSKDHLTTGATEGIYARQRTCAECGKRDATQLIETVSLNFCSADCGFTYALQHMIERAGLADKLAVDRDYMEWRKDVEIDCRVASMWAAVAVALK